MVPSKIKAASSGSWVLLISKDDGNSIVDWRAF